MTIPADVQKQLAALSDNQRARVVAIARRHTEACRRQGAAPEPLGRVLKEAIELVKMEDARGQRQVEDWTAATVGEGLQRQQYEAYSSPTAL